MNDRRPVSTPSSGESVTREDVREFYSKAAVATQESLCCPVQYDQGDLSHIPEEVLAISYGCGSPVNRASIRNGETLVDLGSGGGIDCFIASKIVGPEGRVFGIDMTEKMLENARRHAIQVGENLGYHNVEFHHGFLESIPLEDQCADVVTSNCVINLSTQKRDVFREIHRILKPGGRFVISDIISDRAVPEEMKKDRELWGECISGAVTLNEFLDLARSSDFHGFRVTRDYLWQEVQGFKFYSYILEGTRPGVFEETSCCKKLMAIYAGPFDQIICQGRVYQVGVPVEVDEPTAGLLGAAPYQGLFNIIDPDTEETASAEESCCG